jgi:hypothetical protein
MARTFASVMLEAYKPYFFESDILWVSLITSYIIPSYNLALLYGTQNFRK